MRRPSVVTEVAGGPAGRLWARSELQRRWRAMVVLGLLAGLTCGLAAAAISGARRTDASWERLRHETLASDAIVFASQAGIHQVDWDPVAALPYVDGVGAFSFVAADGVDMLVSQYGDWLTKVDRPRIIEGRRPDPDDPTEVVLERPSIASDPTAPKVHVGQALPAHLFTSEQMKAGRFATPEGPKLTFHVVGISESPFSMSAIPPTAGSLFVGPAFRAHHADAIVEFTNLLVRLHDPARDIRRLEADIARMFPGQGVPVYDLGAASKRVTNGTGLETTGLLLFALAVAAAGMVIVGQALTRSVRAAGGDLSTLSAIGFDRRGRASALALPHLVSAATAVVTASVVAVLLSPRFPIGLGRRVDPDVGLHLDLPIVVGGAAVVGLLLTGATAISAWRASAVQHQGSAERPSSLVGLTRRLGFGVPVVVGAGLALEAGRGRRSLPVRSALTGTAVGVLGLVGALVFLRGLDDAATHPERFGSVWNLEASFDGDDISVWDAVPKQLAADPSVASVSTVGRAQGPVGDIVLPFYAIEPSSGPVLRFTTVDGRGPTRPGEVALGPDSAHVLGLHVGDPLVLNGHRFRVVGLALLPTTPHSSFDQGVWFVPDDVLRAFPMSERRSLSNAFEADLTDDATFETAFFVRGFEAVTFVPGTDEKAAYSRLFKIVSNADGLLDLPTPSADQASMRNVRTLPLLFGVFAPLVALAALLHVSSSAVRRRGTELAILRTLGLTPRQAGACVAWQSTVLAMIGILVGAPVGYAVGRVAWRAVAENTPMLAVIPSPILGLALVLPVTVLAANLAGARPAWRASRTSPAAHLRVD
jgi:hypothetical protein